jgi:hypothetical protein
MTGDIATRRINNSKAWTSAEDERLRQLVISNASPSDIAEDLALQLLFLRASESMGNHDSNVVGAGRVG